VIVIKKCKATVYLKSVLQTKIVINISKKFTYNFVQVNTHVYNVDSVILAIYIIYSVLYIH